MEHLPAALSLDGKQNAYYVQCKRMGFCRAYAACQNEISIVLHGAPSNKPLACESAISSHTCPAVSMRKEELAEGRALFFTPRLVFDDAQHAYPAKPAIEALPSFARDSKQVVTDNKSIPTHVGTYADALNNFNQPAL